MDAIQTYSWFRRSPLRIAAAIPILVLVNLLLRWVNTALAFPFFFDSIATAVAAALFGIVPGVVTGVLTNATLELFTGFELESLPWGVCSAATAIIVGTFIRAGRFRNALDGLWASLAVTLANSLLGAVIAAVLYDGITGVPLDYVVTALVASGRRIVTAAFLARIPSNLVDKTIAVFAALYVYTRIVRPVKEKEA